jgi:integrase
MLTPRQINALEPGRHYQGEGLCFIKNDSGKCRWIFRFTKPTTKKPTETTIGPYPAFSYSEARAEAVRLSGLVAKGIDPVEAKQQDRFNGITYAEACEAFIKHKSPRWRSTKNPRQLLSQAKNLNTTPVGAITPPMLKEALMPVWQEHPYQVIRALPMIASVFRYAKFEKWCSGENPAAWKGNMENVFGGLKRRKVHYASLPFKDVPDFFRQMHIRRVRGASVLALQFQILTACRPGEARNARWSEIDFENKVWVLPPERTKQNRQHRVPLSSRVLEMLALCQERRVNDFIFVGYNKTALDDKALRVLLKNMGVPVTPHGFRSSFRNWCFATRQDRDLAELSLGHDVAEDRTEGAYLTVDGLDERRPVMEDWAAYCGSAT